MTDTPHLGLPYLDPAQALKHVTHNEALRILDACVQLSVLTRASLAPSVSPNEGDRYLAPSGATGVFAGHVDEIAIWQDGAWRFLAPRAGWLLYIADEAHFVVFNSVSWVAANPPPTQLNQLVALGVGTTADAANPFAARLNAALMTASAPAEGGSGNLRVAFNKSATANVGSHLFQTNYSGRAELGLIGDDNFRINVSNDGATFRTVLQADPASGVVSGLQVSDNSFQIRDDADLSKIAQFQLSGLTTATTRTYSLPNISGALATIGALAQTFSGATTFSGNFTHSGAAGVFGSSAANAAYSLGAGATVSGSAKTINIGTAGLSGSTTTIQLGPSAAGAGGSIAANVPLRLSPQTPPPPSPGDGDLWYDATDKLFRCRENGRTVPFGGDDLPFMNPDAGRYLRTTTACGAACATSVGAADRIEIFPFVPRADLNVDRLGLNVATALAGALGRIVLYASNADGRPDVLIVETVDLDLSTLGAKEATVTVALKKGKQYWTGVRSSSTATISAWQQYNTPDLDQPGIATTAGKALRRTLAYASPAPSAWAYASADTVANVNPPAVWLRTA